MSKEKVNNKKKKKNVEKKTKIYKSNRRNKKKKNVKDNEQKFHNFCYILIVILVTLEVTQRDIPQEQHTNKKGDKELKLKLKWLRTAFHVGYSGHRPLRKITIER